jgi:hypothetical protein
MAVRLMTFMRSFQETYSGGSNDWINSNHEFKRKSAYK